MKWYWWTLYGLVCVLALIFGLAYCKARDEMMKPWEWGERWLRENGKENQHE